VAPPPVTAPLRLPPHERTVEQDLALIRRLFGTWTRYVWQQSGHVEATAYTRELPRQQWKVLCLFFEPKGAALPVAASAYVTLPYTEAPNHPGFVVWQYAGAIDLTANMLDAATEESYSATPLALPEKYRPPSQWPTRIKPASD
jgi:hypothetical protein